MRKSKNENYQSDLSPPTAQSTNRRNDKTVKRVAIALVLLISVLLVRESIHTVIPGIEV